MFAMTTMVNINRRDFLKLLGVSAASVAIGNFSPYISLANGGKQLNPDDVRIANWYTTVNRPM